MKDGWEDMSMSDGEIAHDGLDDEWRDKLVAIGKGAAGLIPMVGGPLAEIVGVVVPGQRVDRIAAYLRSLALRVNDLADEVKTNLASNAEKIDLIEEGGYQSARATSRQRIEQIVEAVSRGLSEDDADVIRRKRLLLILGELDEDEVNLLNAYGKSYAGADRQAFDQVHRPNPPHMQSTTAELDRDRLHQVGRENLLRLGLLKKNYGNVKKGQIPDFDASKGDFNHSVEVSYLGRMVLKEIGMQTPFDAQQTDR